MAAIDQLTHAAVLDRDMRIPVSIFGQTLYITLEQLLAAQNTLTLAQYSEDGDNWHDEIGGNDRFTRISTDGGNTWGPAINLYDPDAQPTQGTDGQSLYTWMKFADTENPQTSADIYDTPKSTTEAIGWAYNKTTPQESTDPNDYEWTRFKGRDAVQSVDVSEYFAVGESSTLPPSLGWTEVPKDAMPQMSAEKPYLWNYERTTYSDGTWRDTTPHVVGQMGADGNSITSVTDYYLAHKNVLGVKSDYKGWTTDIDDAQAQWGETLPFLWNYEERHWSNGGTDKTKPRVIARWAKDGLPGQTTMTSYVFRAAAEQPDAPSGGSFASPVPEGWSDGFPAKASDDDEYWMSLRIFTSDGNAPQTAEWSDPVRMTSSSGVQIRYSSSEEQPATDPLTWSDKATTATIWMAVRTRAVGVRGASPWGDWQISRIKGEKGLQGDKGDKGDKGNQGDKGDSITARWSGTSLIINSAGKDLSAIDLKGTKGDKGDQGLQGLQGLQGDKGDKGDNGKTFRPYLDGDILKFAVSTDTSNASLASVATQSWVNGKGFLTQHQSLSGYAKTTDIPTKLSQLTNDSGYTKFSGNYADLSGKPSLFSGNYADLNGKPNIPSVSLSGGTITINGSSITPLTQHQSLNGYAKTTDIQSYVDEQVNEANKGVVKYENGKLTAVVCSGNMCEKKELETTLNIDTDYIMSHHTGRNLPTFGQIPGDPMTYFVSKVSTDSYGHVTGVSHAGIDLTQYLTSHQVLDHINNLGNLTAVSGTTTMPSGLRLYSVYNNGYPCTYGNLLRVGGIGSGELLCEWTSSTSCGRLYYRSKRYVASTEWSGWTTVAFLHDNVSSATRLQGTYSLWGQNFYGNNVSGDISNCTRIKNASNSPLYLGNADNSNWVLTQDICSHNAAGDAYWSLRTDGTAHFKDTTINGALGISGNAGVGGSFGINSTSGGGAGISLYGGTGYVQTYGIMFAQTAKFGTANSNVTGAWATYFTMDGQESNTRGWIFRNASSGDNVASINAAGFLACRNLGVTYDVSVNRNLIINNAGTVKINGEAGRVVALDSDGVKVNARTDNGGSVCAFTARNSSGSTLGACAGVLLSGNAIQYYFYGGTWDNPKMCLTTGGNFGIGTTSPLDKLHVVNGTIRVTTSGSHSIYITNNGGHSCAMNVVDGIYTSLNVECTHLIENSDINLKNIKRHISPSIYAIAGARTVEFTWKKNGYADCGCIAQDWQGILPHTVIRSNHTGYLSLDYGKAALVSVISVARKTCEHESRIATLERKNAALERKNAALEADNRELRGIIDTLQEIIQSQGIIQNQ